MVESFPHETTYHVNLRKQNNNVLRKCQIFVSPEFPFEKRKIQQQSQLRQPPTGFPSPICTHRVSAFFIYILFSRICLNRNSSFSKWRFICSTVRYCSTYECIHLICLQSHKEIRYIEWYRVFLMTIWRQHFFGSANVARIRTPSPPLPDFLSATQAFYAFLLVSPPHLSFPMWTPSLMSATQYHMNTTWGRGGEVVQGHWSA